MPCNMMDGWKPEPDREAELMARASIPTINLLIKRIAALGEAMCAVIVMVRFHPRLFGSKFSRFGLYR